MPDPTAGPTSHAVRLMGAQIGSGAPAADGADRPPLADSDVREVLMGHAPDSIILVDSDGVIRFATPSVDPLLGVALECVLGRQLASFFAEEEATRVEQAIRDTSSGSGEPFRLDAQIHHPQARTVEMTARRTMDPRGAPVLVVIARDVTEQRRSEAALRTSEERYRRLFEDDLTGDFISTPEGDVLACNTAFSTMLGYSSVAEAMSMRADSFYVDPEVRESLLKRLREEQALKRIELELCRKDGRSVHVVLNVFGTFDAHGELVSLQGSLFDITEQRRLADERTQLLLRERAARSLAEAAERRTAFLAELGSALDSSLDYRKTLAKLARMVVPTLCDYCLIDERTVEGGSQRVSVAHVDSQAERLLLPDEHNPPDADPARHPVLHVLRTGEPILVPEVSERALEEIAHDPEHLSVLRAIGIRSYIIVPLSARGRILGALTLVSSVSRRRFSQHDVELAEAVATRAALAVDNARLYSRAQQAARTREEVLAFVSHDLRNPLATILLNASALVETIPADRLRAEEREQLEWIAHSSEQMNRMIQDLLDVARIESGRLPIRPVATQIDRVLQEAHVLLHPLAREKNIQLETMRVSPDLVALVDPERCVRVLSNLIGNSIQFTPSGGRIRVSVESLDAMCRVAVEDTGIGIEQEEGARLFEPYWQGRRAGSGRHHGSGLGLAIARGIIEAHGGSIWFESTPGVGTTFFFTVPVAAEALAADR